MKIAYITAGAAGMYCGSCLHDNTLAAAMQRAGHDVTLIPTYTPIRTDEHDVSVDQVFYGALNVYLEQKSAVFRHLPPFVDRLLRSRGLLEWIAGRGSRTDARDLGALTLSVLRGEAGHQRKELVRLVDWLRELQPDVVHLTNSMFLGMARSIREALGVPVFCSVQGEDLFLEDLPEPVRSEVRAEIGRRTVDVEAFVAPSDYYAAYMADYLALPPGRIQTVRLGLRLEGHGAPAADRPERPFRIAYLARLCPEKGLHLLADAFRELSRRAGPGQVRLGIAGFLSPKDRAYLAEVTERLREWGLEEHVELLGEVDREAKIRFLQSSHVLCVPTVYREPKGLFVLEALANGIPVVQPRHGAFPELVQATGGGLLHEPGSTDDLVRSLASLMDDSERRERFGRDGREAVRRDFSDDAMAEATVRLYAEGLAGRKPRRRASGA